MVEYEFEVFKGEVYFVAMPYDFEGGTQGEDFENAVRMAGDWLRGTVEECEDRGLALPVPTRGNEPRHGGENVLVSSETGLGHPGTASPDESFLLLPPHERIEEVLVQAIYRQAGIED